SASTTASRSSRSTRAAGRACTSRTRRRRLRSRTTCACCCTPTREGASTGVRRVLHLAYFFPPIGGAGVQRNVKFARTLPSLGWQPVVVTGPGAPEYRWAPIDAELLEGLPAEVEVHRVVAREPPRSGGLRGKAERW